MIPYLLAIWGLVIINTAFRSLGTRLTTATLLALPGADSTLVTFPSLSRGFTSGQHVRIRMFGLGYKRMFESHPFTIASPDEAEGGIRCVIKQAGDWTNALHQLALSSEKAVTVRCTVEGPYGERFRHQDHLSSGFTE